MIVLLPIGEPRRAQLEVGAFSKESHFFCIMGTKLLPEVTIIQMVI